MENRVKGLVKEDPETSTRTGETGRVRGLGCEERGRER